MSDALELAVVRAAELAPNNSEDEWLIESIWGKSSVGIVGGCPKTWKSWYGLEMAVSVASDTPCLARFPVRDPGTALVYLAEDALGSVRERIEGLCRTRGKAIEEIDLYVITEPVLRLDDEACRERLERTVTKYHPKLLLLDPLIRLHRLSENDSQEISGLLGHLRELQRRHEVSIVLVHHASKRRRAQPGQSLRGSSDLHAWTDTTAILSRTDDHVTVTIEHRFAPAPSPMILGLSVTGGTAGLVLLGDDPAPGGNGSSDLEATVLKEIRETGRPLRRGEIRKRVRANNEKLGNVLTALEAAGRLRRGEDGWSMGSDNGKERGQGDLFVTGTG